MMIDLSCLVFTGWDVLYVRSICASSLKQAQEVNLLIVPRGKLLFWYSLAKGHWEVIAYICVHHEQFSLLSVAKKDHCFLRLTRMWGNVAACSLQHLQTFLTPLAHQSIQHGELTAYFSSSCALIQCHLCPMKTAVSGWFLFACLALTSFTLSQNHQIALLDKSCLSRGIAKARKPVKVKGLSFIN